MLFLRSCYRDLCCVYSHATLKFFFLKSNSRLIMSITKTRFYAVVEGKKPGVYNTWGKCEAQVKGFSRAVFKGFSTHEKALEFFNKNSRIKISQNVCDTNLTLQSPAKGSFYAVHIGKKPGVYRAWSQCEAQIKGLDKVCYRKFDNEPDALHYVRTGGVLNATKTHLRDLVYDNKVVKKRKLDECVDEENVSSYELADPNETVVVFTDGACSENGKRRAIAGIGVYWGPNHPLNTSKRLSGRQTNNRAEIHAAIYALKQAKQINAKKVKLYTDSKFLIRGVTDWMKKWKQNGWMLTTGEPVKNKDDFIELDEACELLDVEWMYVKAHAYNAGNDEADRLAVRGKMLPLPPPPDKKLKKICTNNISSLASVVSEKDTQFSDSLEENFFNLDGSSIIEMFDAFDHSQDSSQESASLIYSDLSERETYFAVKKGKQPGIYQTWSECEAQVKGYHGSCYKKFSTLKEASEFLDSDVIVSSMNSHNLQFDPVDGFVCVYTDGACSSNGQEDCQAGFGVFWGPDSELNTSKRLSGRQSNNRAEIHAIVHALRQAKQLGLENIRIYTDSQFCINGITKWIQRWKKNGWKLANRKPVINKEDFQVLDEMCQGINVDWCYVKGHDNNPGNVEADQLAVAGSKMPPSQS